MVIKVRVLAVHVLAVHVLAVHVLAGRGYIGASMTNLHGVRLEQLVLQSFQVPYVADHDCHPLVAGGRRWV